MFSRFFYINLQILLNFIYLEMATTTIQSTIFACRQAAMQNNGPRFTLRILTSQQPLFKSSVLARTGCHACWISQTELQNVSDLNSAL